MPIDMPTELPSIQDLIDRNNPYNAANYQGLLLSQPAQSDPNVAGAAAFNQTQPTPTPAPRDVASAAQQSVAAATTPPQTQQQGGGKEPTPVNQILDKLMKDLGSTKKSYGPDVFDSKAGGILGSGISPMAAILFGLGAVATRKAPKATAWDVSMKLMGLPQEYEHAQQQLANQKTQQAVELLGLGQKQQELTQKEKQAAIADQYRQVGQQAVANGQLVPHSFDPVTGKILYQPGEEPLTAESAAASFHGMGFPDERIPSMVQGIMGLPKSMQKPYLQSMLQEHLKSIAAPKLSQTMQDRDTLAVAEGYPDYKSAPNPVQRKIMGDLYGMQAGARAAGTFTGRTGAEQAQPGSAAQAGMVKYNSATNKFEYPGPDDTVASFRNAGGVQLKGPNAAKTLEAIQKDPALMASFNQLKVNGLLASQNMIGATLGERAGGQAGRAAKDYEAEKKLFGQLWDSYWAGARGAASTGLAQMTMDRLPVVGIGPTHIGDTPQLAATKFTQFQNVLGALRNELIAKAGGKPTEDYVKKTDEVTRKYLGISEAEYKRLSNLDISGGPATTTTPPPFMRK